VEKVEMGRLTIRPAPPAGADPSGTVPAWRFLFVPQSWTISIELLFYLVVPWLISWRTRNLILLGSLSLASYLANCLFVYPALSDPCLPHPHEMGFACAGGSQQKRGDLPAGLAAVARGNRAGRVVVVAGRLSD
jgi:peptidoglycan/LPS O-acetylase OafA/YrhL